MEIVFFAEGALLGFIIGGLIGIYIGATGPNKRS